jgi:hypothetical protein
MVDEALRQKILTANGIADPTDANIEAVKNLVQHELDSYEGEDFRSYIYDLLPPGWHPYTTDDGGVVVYTNLAPVLTCSPS